MTATTIRDKPATPRTARADAPRIVIVDDDPLLCDTLRASLELDGYTVYTATSGGEGLSLITRHHPQGVITDLLMPGIDGIQLARQVRLAADPSTVLIVLTGSTEKAHHALAGGVGADHVLLKPFDHGSLRAMLPPLPAR